MGDPMTQLSLYDRLQARRLKRQHEAGVHTDCDRRTCEWWAKSEWARRGLPVKLDYGRVA